MPVIFKLGSFPIEQVVDLDGLERRLGGWFAGLTYPVRLLAYSRRFEMRPATERVRRELADIERLRRAVAPMLAAIDSLFGGAPYPHPRAVWQELPLATQALLIDLASDADLLTYALDPVVAADDEQACHAWALLGDALDSLLWRLPWTKEMVRFYEALQHKHLRSATYVLIAWPPTDVSASAIGATLRHAIGREVQQIDALPAVIDGPYRERATHLAPEQPGQPRIAALLAYDARGTWQATTLHSLLDVTYDVAVAIDIQTMTRNRAMRAAEMAYNVARVVARDAQVVDMRAQRVVHAAERVMHELVSESLHTVQIGVLVGGATAEQLETNLAETSGRLGTQLRLMRPAGVQGELIKLWSLAPHAKIDAPFKPRTMLSHGVGCCAGLLGYHRSSSTEGIFWGMDAMRRAPLFFDLFRNNQAAHTVILGKTGSGKTYFLNTLALRSAALAGHRIIALDAFKNGQRLAAAARAGARCDQITLETAINFFDVVFRDEDGQGDWRTPQVQYVMSMLALLQGTPARTPDGRAFYQPRQFSIAERGILDRALCLLYADVEPDAPLTQMPLMSDLIAVLEGIAIAEASALARDLRITIYGSDDPAATELNSIGRRFNAHTNIDISFAHDLNLLDFSGIYTAAEEQVSMYYGYFVGKVMRFMRDPSRDLSRKTLLLLDELGYLMQNEALGQLAATLCKVARKYAIGLVTIDQNPITFLGSTNGRYIFENSVAKVIFHLDDQPAREIGEAISDLTPGHIDFLSNAGVGECLAVVGNDVYVMTVESNPKELRALRGS